MSMTITKLARAYTKPLVLISLWVLSLEVGVLKYRQEGHITFVTPQPRLTYDALWCRNVFKLWVQIV